MCPLNVNFFRDILIHFDGSAVKGAIAMYASHGFSIDFAMGSLVPLRLKLSIPSVVYRSGTFGGFTR